MSFNDVLKKSFLNSFVATGVDRLDVCLIIGMTLVISLYIFFIYRIMNRKNFYNKNFNISLVALALITASIIISIQSSVVVSLGMVGALSIVRFRTAVKDPLDLVYLFWTLSVGIICGVGLFEVAIMFAIVVTIILFALDNLPIAKTPVILVVQGNRRDLEPEIMECVKLNAKYYKVKSRNISKGQLNLIVEVRVKTAENLLQRVCDIEGVEYASVIDHNGETAF